ncbi:hypothetical protein MAPG_06051 [Magnaporthiopsis poae ATCC 64411]|uniref:Uncharacterized protein n=1 Tax=Magnaporthiopsis poae (strain ATCC 64411 / 73-15) TaxID=644358 RepID=A0A0C4E107_MAGP6|nr:hypothetical protein MAPG_06051 [Magnaporthiopsis poae ATCC 64411]
MYQLIFQWAAVMASQMSAVDFWVGMNCGQDPAEQQPYPTDDIGIAEIKPLLERQVGGCTGGILQIVPSDNGGWTVGLLHRTVYDWLRDVWPTVISDGPSTFDPAVVIASVFASKPSKSESSAAAAASRKSGIANVFRFGRACRDLPESRSSTVRIIDGLSREDLVHALRPFMVVSASGGPAMRQSTAALRSLAAITYACVPYLQAKIQSGALEKSLGLSRMRLFRGLIWSGSKSMKGRLSLVFEATVEALTYETAQHLRVQTLKLVLEIPSVSRGAIEREVTRHIDGPNKATREYWTTVLDVLRGRAPVKEVPGRVGPSTLMEQYRGRHACQTVGI